MSVRRDAPMKNVVELIHRLMEASVSAGDHTAGRSSLWEMLPKLVVVGGQSSGKSSVLESVVGKDFLPRGKGIVTKRPLVVSLKHVEGEEEWGEFHHHKHKKWYNFVPERYEEAVGRSNERVDFKSNPVEITEGTEQRQAVKKLARQLTTDDICEEITNDTVRHLAELNAKNPGQGRIDVSSSPIFLSVFSPKVPTLTLVDLPGLVTHAMADQSPTIVKDLEKMVRNFIKDESAIILAVTPAPEDLANSRALQMAREVDKTLRRTIGIVTKIDLMDRGTDARDLILNKQFHLNLGWVGVVNRSQADIESEKSMEAARDAENEFFRGSEVYSDLENVGTDFLSQRLSQHLVDTIRSKLPEIIAQINDSIAAIRKELDAMGGPVETSRGGMLFHIMEICNEFQKEYESLVDHGQGGGEKILDVFERKFPEDINKQEFEKLLEVKRVKEVIVEAEGYRPHLVAPEEGYRRMVEKGIELVEGPAIRSVQAVHTILRDLVKRVAALKELAVLNRYPALRDHMIRKANESLEKQRELAENMVKKLVVMEPAYIQPEVFRKAIGDPDLHKNIRVGAEMDYGRISSHVRGFLKSAVQSLQFSIPKAIVYYQVRGSQDQLLRQLRIDVANMDEGQLSQVLGEDPAVEKRRKELLGKKTLLEGALQKINDLG